MLIAATPKVYAFQVESAEQVNRIFGLFSNSSKPYTGAKERSDDPSLIDYCWYYRNSVKKGNWFVFDFPFTDGPRQFCDEDFRKWFSVNEQQSLTPSRRLKSQSCIRETNRNSGSSQR